MERLAAIVLAAGRSSRMGGSKPLEDIAGRPMLAWAIATFVEAGIGRVVVVAGPRRDEIAEVAAAAGAEVLTDPGHDAGMYSSLRIGLLGLEDDVMRFFVLPADVPLVRPETVGRLVRQGRVAAREAGRRGADVVLPVHVGRLGHPPLLGHALRASIREVDPPGGLHGLLDASETMTVEVDDPGVLLDVDTPEDLAHVRGVASREGLPDVRGCLSLLTRRRVERDRIAHSLVVAGVATSLTTALNARGQHLIPELVTAGALLHDVGRSEPRHADAGADLLDGLGYPRVAAVVRPHADLGARGADEPDEAQIIYLADKLVQGTRVAGLDARFAARMERFAGDEAALSGVRVRMREAQRVQRSVERVLGARIDEVLPEGASLQTGRRILLPRRRGG